MIRLEILNLLDDGEHVLITCNVHRYVGRLPLARMSFAPLRKLSDFKVVDQSLLFPSDLPLPQFDEALVSSDLDIKFRNHVAYQHFVELVGERLHVHGRVFRLSVEIDLAEVIVRVHDLSGDKCIESPYLTFAWRLLSGNWEGLSIGYCLGDERHSAWRLAQQYLIMRWLTGALPPQLSWNHKRQALELNELAGTPAGLVRLRELKTTPGTIPGIELSVAGQSQPVVIHATELAQLPQRFVRACIFRLARAGRTPPIDLSVHWDT